ncbi:MAG: type II secretion system protein GspJ [Candidatus Omnitrophota bacterium]
MKNKNGLTFVEVLITCFMVALIGIAVYSSLNNGIRAWQRVQQKMPEEDIAIFFDKFLNDVSNSFQYPQISFSGNQTYVAFPAMIGIGIGRSSYNFNPGQGRLERAQEAYSDIFESKAPQFYSILSDVSAFVLSYYFYDVEEEEFIWSHEWPPQEGKPLDANIPLAVRAAIEVNNGKKTYGYTKVIQLPLAVR